MLAVNVHLNANDTVIMVFVVDVFPISSESAT